MSWDHLRAGVAKKLWIHLSRRHHEWGGMVHYDSKPPSSRGLEFLRQVSFAREDRQFLPQKTARRRLSAGVSVTRFSLFASDVFVAWAVSVDTLRDVLRFCC